MMFEVFGYGILFGFPTYLALPRNWGWRMRGIFAALAFVFGLILGSLVLLDEARKAPERAAEYPYRLLHP